MPKTIIAKTITPLYDAVEDRLRVSINYQEINSRIDMMITRSLMIRLLDHVGDYLLQSYPKESIENFTIAPNTDASSSPAEKNNPTDMQDFELYKSDEDLLVTLHLTLDKKSMRTKVVFVTKQKHQIILNADEAMFKKVFNLLEAATPKIQWGIAQKW